MNFGVARYAFDKGPVVELKSNVRIGNRTDVRTAKLHMYRPGIIQPARVEFSEFADQANRPGKIPDIDLSETILDAKRISGGHDDFIIYIELPVVISVFILFAIAHLAHMADICFERDLISAPPVGYADLIHHLPGFVVGRCIHHNFNIHLDLIFIPGTDGHIAERIFDGQFLVAAYGVGFTDVLSVFSIISRSNAEQGNQQEGQDGSSLNGFICFFIR